MYDLLQADMLARKLLEQELAKYRYHQSKLTPGFCAHKTKLIQFCYNFGVKYLGRKDAAIMIYELTGKEKNVGLIFK